MVAKRRVARRGRAKKTGHSKLRISRGRIGLRVPGFKNLQYLSAAALLELIPKTKVTKAAKRLLGRPPKAIRKKPAKKKAAGRRKKRSGGRK